MARRRAHRVDRPAAPRATAADAVLRCRHCASAQLRQPAQLRGAYSWKPAAALEGHADDAPSCCVYCSFCRRRQHPAPARVHLMRQMSPLVLLISSAGAVFACATAPPHSVLRDALLLRTGRIGWQLQTANRTACAASVCPCRFVTRLCAPRRDLLPTPRIQTASRRDRGLSLVSTMAPREALRPLKALSRFCVGATVPAPPPFAKLFLNPCEERQAERTLPGTAPFGVRARRSDTARPHFFGKRYLHQAFFCL